MLKASNETPRGRLAQVAAEEMASAQVEVLQVNCSCDWQQCNKGLVGRLPRNEELRKKEGDLIRGKREISELQGSSEWYNYDDSIFLKSPGWDGIADDCLVLPLLW